MRGCLAFVGMLLAVVWALVATGALLFGAFLPAIEKFPDWGMEGQIPVFLVTWLVLAAWPGYAIYDACSGRHLSSLRKRQ